MTPLSIAFVTGTRAEFGLMRTTLHAIRAHPALKLQLIATGMHLDPRHGPGPAALADAGFPPDRLISWPPETGRSPAFNAAAAGRAMADLAKAYEELNTAVVLVVGDRPEAFAAAAAAHLSHRIVAHIHGGDRALGQVDDSLRHAITKLAHVHFPATPQSAERLRRLGEDDWRIHPVGTPGIDGIVESAAPWERVSARFPALKARRYAVILLHPTDPDEQTEFTRAQAILNAASAAGFDHLVLACPNNDPGCAGILRCWEQTLDARHFLCRDLPRDLFLGLLRDSAALVGNSSSGIIEAASFGLPVLDIGPRQQGREHGPNVAHCDYDASSLSRELTRLWNAAHPPRFPEDNPYGGHATGQRIAEALAALPPRDQLLRKLIAY